MSQVKSVSGPQVKVSRSGQILAALCLAFFLPLLLLIAILIKCGSPGPALLKRDRADRDGDSVMYWEFRMVAINARNGDNTIRSCPPYTALGAFLGRTRLGQIPALLNVLRGEASWDALLD